jgi:hypothetical protein
MEKYLTPLPISVYIHGVRKRGDFVPEHMDRATKKELRLPRIDITFDEFLHDLQEIVGVHLDNNVRASTADEPDPLPRIQCDFGESGSVVIDGEEFATLWHDLRVHGALQTNDFPGSLGVHSDDVARMLTQLDYIRPMAFEDPPDAIGGIRFAPSGNKDRPTHQSVIPERETLD